MIQMRDIHTKYLKFRVSAQTQDGITHAAMADQELQSVIRKGFDYLQGLIESYEKEHEETLKQIGK